MIPSFFKILFSGIGLKVLVQSVNFQHFQKNYLKYHGFNLQLVSSKLSYKPNKGIKFIQT